MSKQAQKKVFSLTMTSENIYSAREIKSFHFAMATIRKTVFYYYYYFFFQTSNEILLFFLEDEDSDLIFICLKNFVQLLHKVRQQSFIF